MSRIDPNEFIISRKRKKYKFALFANSPLCFELEEWLLSRPDVFSVSRVAAGAAEAGGSAEKSQDGLALLCLEIGAGTALFSVELATRYPDKQFVAVDVKADRLQTGAREAEARGLRNVCFLRARADQLFECFEPGSLESIWLTFPDPFPRERSAKHRLTHPRFLNLYTELLRIDGSLNLKHDDQAFFHWSLEQLVTQKWHLDELCFDLQESELSDDFKILTTYERRWLSEGLKTHFVKARNVNNHCF